MIQQAKEDLELLETQHPNQFEYLKHDLRSFIFLLQPQQLPTSALQLSLVSHKLQLVRRGQRKVSFHHSMQRWEEEVEDALPINFEHLIATMQPMESTWFLRRLNQKI